jgi:hypothetical protein
MSASEFQNALRRLVTDEGYRQTVESDPQRLSNDFALSPGEIGLLAAVWEATGSTPEVVGHSMTLCSWAACCCSCEA